MAKLLDKTRVYGSLSVDKAIIGNTGFQNMIIFTTGTAATFTLPPSLQIHGAKFKLTIIGGGGGSSTTAATVGLVGAGAGAGAVGTIILSVVAGLYTITYTVGATAAVGGAGNLSSVVYNGVTYSAGGGAAAGTGGSFTGITNGTTLNAFAIPGFSGAPSGTNASNTNAVGNGGDTPLGYGKGGRSADGGSGGYDGTGSIGLAGTGYGSGASGPRNGSLATARSGNGTFLGGLIILQY